MGYGCQPGRRSGAALAGGPSGAHERWLPSLLFRSPELQAFDQLDLARDVAGQGCSGSFKSV